LSKSETAQLLRSLGFSYLEIAAELYPQDYRRYRETRDRRLYQLLKKRVWKLLRLSGGPQPGGGVAPPGRWTLEDPLGDSGGEREPLEHGAREPLLHPGTRKDGKRGAERQLIEYEQLIYHYYRRVEEYDPSGAVWATARLLGSFTTGHSKVL